MDLFRIDDDLCDENTKYIHPAFLLKDYQHNPLKKGTKIEFPPPNMIGCNYSIRRKGLSSLFGSKYTQWVDRMLAFVDDTIYLYELKKSKLIVRHAWSLHRLLELKIKSEDHSEMTLVFANKTLNPLDEFKHKMIRVELHDLFIRLLKQQLTSLKIQLIL